MTTKRLAELRVLEQYLRDELAAVEEEIRRATADESRAPVSVEGRRRRRRHGKRNTPWAGDV